MMNPINQVIFEFEKAIGSRLTRVQSFGVVSEVYSAPHEPSSLPLGQQGVYTFSFDGVYLKVGKAGPNSGARWKSQHYNPASAVSNLAWSLFLYAHSTKYYPNLPSALREELLGLRLDELGPWIKRRTDRVNFLIPASAGREALSELERIALANLRPVFEGHNNRELHPPGIR